MTAIAEGRSLELYFIDGRPDGMLTAEVFNWTGHVLMTPRTRLSEALARKEAGYTGVYILLGEQDGEMRAYIGEGEDIRWRIGNHDKSKDWWTDAVLVTAMANNLNKAHVKYLEARLIEEAKAAARVNLDNGNAPNRPSLSEAQRSNMEGFLSYLFMVLPGLRVEMFVSNTRPDLRVSPVGSSATAPRFKLVNERHKLEATAVLENGDFIVEAGSLARSRWEGKGAETSGYALLHTELKKSGVLVEQDGRGVFTQNYAFRSPSAAAAVVNGRQFNGTWEWKLAGGGLGSDVSYKEWEARQLGQSIGVEG